MKKLLPFILVLASMQFVIPFVTHAQSTLSIPDQVDIPDLVFSGIDISGSQIQIAFVALKFIPRRTEFLLTDGNYRISDGVIVSRRNQGDMFIRLTTQRNGLQPGQVFVITINTEEPAGYSVEGANITVRGWGSSLSNLNIEQDETLYLTSQGNFFPSIGGKPAKIFSALNISSESINARSNPENNLLEPDHANALVIDLDPDPMDNIKAADFKESMRPDPTKEDLQNIDNWKLSDTGFQLSFSPFFVPLPVELISFTGTLESTNVLLEWETASEINSMGFDVEKSSDGISWEAIGFVNSLGNTIQSQSYTYVDEDVVSGQHFYRLKQTDFDGVFEYSQVIVIHVKATKNLEISFYPNPARDYLNVQTTSLVQSIQVEIFNATGQSILNHRLSNGPSVDISGLPNGNYFAKIISPENEETIRFIKQ